jgi:signal transduction histidine kinase
VGLRAQIALALVSLMLLAFGPLFFAVASLTRANAFGERQRAAAALGRVIGEHVAAAVARHEPGGVQQALGELLGSPDVVAICAFAEGRVALGCAGDPAEQALIRPPRTEAPDSVRVVRGASGATLLEVTGRRPGADVVSRLPLDSADDPGMPLVRLVGFYMAAFAIALLVFALIALTRLIVRPVDALVAAANRVAAGARTLRVAPAGARELTDLGVSMQSMAERLIGEEAALRIKLDELTETTDRLTQTQSELVRSERMASVGHLAAGLAHEIGNPLAALMGMQDLLLDGDLAPETQRDFVERMRRETERIHAVVRHLLDFARPEGRLPEPVPEAAANVRAVVEDVMALVRPQRAFRSLQLSTDLPATLDVALAAPRLTQVLLNLILNAGAAATTVPDADARVTVRARREGEQMVRIEVEDSGPGISPDVRDRLFEPFTTSKPIGEGTGLGLAVCRGLVESARGRIGFEDGRPSGALFYVILPSAPHDGN